MAASPGNGRGGTGLARRPLVDEVRDAITAELILSKAVLPGQRLPTEAELCERYGVSRITVRSALRSLRESGYITVRQGFGSTVAPRLDIITSGIDQLCSFETFAAQQGHQVTSAELEIEEVSLSERQARHFDLPRGSRALVIRRTKLYGGVTVGWIVDYVPPASSTSRRSPTSSPAQSSTSCSTTPRSASITPTATWCPSHWTASSPPS